MVCIGTRAARSCAIRQRLRRVARVVATCTAIVLRCNVHHTATWCAALPRGVSHAGAPFALLVKKNCFEPYDCHAAASPYRPLQHVALRYSMRAVSQHPPALCCNTPRCVATANALHRVAPRRRGVVKRRERAQVRLPRGRVAVQPDARGGDPRAAARGAREREPAPHPPRWSAVTPLQRRAPL